MYRMGMMAPVMRTVEMMICQKSLASTASQQLTNQMVTKETAIPEAVMTRGK
jgi:hypothetical protein